MTPPDSAAICTGDDSCPVPDHWPDPASSGPHRGTTTAALVPVRGMTVERLIDHLSRMPGDTEVVVNATDGNVEVFALLKAVEYEPTCDDAMVCRLYADQEDDDAI